MSLHKKTGLKTVLEIWTGKIQTFSNYDQKGQKPADTRLAANASRRRCNLTLASAYGSDPCLASRAPNPGGERRAKLFIEDLKVSLHR
ncbi:MAG: hypothetical protein LBR26_01030 [Prevotella sp.]|nr:hypothetical protein [Prevotella sp.]